MKRFGLSKVEERPVEAVILFWVGLHRLAISASELQEIRNDAGLAPADSGCTAVVVASALFGGAAPEDGRLLVLRRGNVGVRVDGVDRLVEIATVYALPQTFQGDERAWYRGLAAVGDDVIPLVNPEVFVRQAQRAALALVPAAAGLPASVQTQGADRA